MNLTQAQAINIMLQVKDAVLQWVNIASEVNVLQNKIEKIGAYISRAIDIAFTNKT